VFTHSNVGKPGAPDAERVKINAGIWRFHPQRQTFEVYAHGTSNPWGMDWNEEGELIAEAMRDSASFPHLPGRALPAAGGPAFQHAHV
jgi:hypothetical protein